MHKATDVGMHFELPAVTDLPPHDRLSQTREATLQTLPISCPISVTPPRCLFYIISGASYVRLDKIAELYNLPNLQSTSPLHQTHTEPQPLYITASKWLLAIKSPIKWDHITTSPRGGFSLCVVLCINIMSRKPPHY